MASEAGRTATLEGAADLKFVEATLDALDRLLAAEPGVGADDRMLFQLAVSEVATNIAEHGQPPGSVRVSVTIDIDPDRLCATFVDSAQPASIVLADAAMPSAEQESGRGVALALMSLDEFTHERAGGNVWRLRRDRRDGTAR